MRPKLRPVFFLIVVLLIFLPFKTALALVVDAPIKVDKSENHSEKIVSFSVLTVGLPKFEENHNSGLDASLNNLPIIKNETDIGIQGVLNSAILNLKELTDEFAPTPIPTSVLLFGTGLIGLIGIARRSFFTN